MVGNTRCLSISGDTLKRTSNVLNFNWIFVKIVVVLKKQAVEKIEVMLAASETHTKTIQNTLF